MSTAPTRLPLVFFAALLLMTGVAAGAFGAHALKSFATPDMLATWQTAVLYQLVHGLSILALVPLSLTLNTRWLHVAGYLMLLGTVIFSGSLYVLVLTGTKWLGAITPFGGTLFLVAWALVAFAAVRCCNVGQGPRENS